MSGRNARRQRSRALVDAIFARDVTAARRLIEAGVEVDPRDAEHGETGLMLAAQVGSEDLVRLFLQRGADVQAIDRVYGLSTLGYALWGGNRQDVAALIEAGADVNALGEIGETVLMHAVESGDEELVAWLLEKGADPNIESAGETALALADAHGFVRIAERLRRSMAR